MSRNEKTEKELTKAEKEEKKINKEETQEQQGEFSPDRFSVRDLRRHQGPKTSRNPRVIR